MSDKNQRVRIYRLTARGRKQLTSERSRWELLSAAMAGVLSPQGESAGMKFIDLFPWRRDRRAELLREEIAAHIRMEAETRVARGETADDAALNARRDFGNAALVHELTRDALGRSLARAPLARPTLRRTDAAARSGRSPSSPSPVSRSASAPTPSSSAGWRAFCWRPYPGVAQQDRLVAVAGTARGTTGFDSMSWPDFVDLSRGTTSFSAFIASKITGANVHRQATAPTD